VFRAEVKGRVLHFDPDGDTGGNEVYKDRETGSRWQQSMSTAMSGPLKGTHLAVYPFLMTTWGEWKKQHPNTLVLKPEPGYLEMMPMMNRILNRGIAGMGPDPKGTLRQDTRLRPREMVLGLEVGKEEIAYPITALREVRVVNDRVGGKPVLIVHQPTADTTTAFEAKWKGKTLRFEAADQEADRILDLQTQSSWNAYGLCVSGPLKGAQLKSLILEPEFWFAWSEFRPETRVYQAGNVPVKGTGSTN
jgi:Protein of unknown function (DUF3179)